MNKLFKTAFYTLVSCWLLMLFISGCVSPQPVVVQTPSGPVTNQVYGPNPNLNNISNAVSGALGAAAVVPAAAPYVTLGQILTALAFGGVGAVSTWYAQRKNGTMLASVIQGVEDATSAATVTPDAVKAAIQDRATAAGVQAALDKRVQALT